MTRPLRIGLDLTFHGARAGGVGTYARELAASLAVREDVELHVFLATAAPPELAEADWLDAARVAHVRMPPGRGAALMTFAGIPALALTRRLDVLHGPANGGAVGVPGLRCVVTLHDVIWAHAQTDWASPAEIAIVARAARRVARRADLLIADCETAADDLVATLDLARDRLAVARAGVRPPLAAATGREDALLLSVGQKRRYKDHAVLITALALLPGVRPVLPGAGALDDDLRAQAERLGVSDRLDLPGWVPAGELAALYARATVVVQPSRYEGFGLPVLEAMAAGAPVVCSDIPAHREVGGDAAHFFSVGDATACARALGELLADGGARERVARAGRLRAGEWTWDRCAEETVEGYRRIASRAT